MQKKGYSDLEVLKLFMKKIATIIILTILVNIFYNLY